VLLPGELGGKFDVAFLEVCTLRVLF